MLKLITANHWIRETFPEGGVGARTVEKWVRNGVIHGKIINGKVFVDADRTALLLDNHTVINTHQAEAKPTESTDLVAQIVNRARAA